MVSYFLLGLDALPERRMVDDAAAATDYQRQRRGRALAESFVVTAEGIGFGKGTSGVDIEQCSHAGVGRLIAWRVWDGMSDGGPHYSVADYHDGS